MSDGATTETTSREIDGRLLALSLGALGVVYGDIGTSPLYALRVCFDAGHGVAPTIPNVLGVLSLIFWALVVVISIKYLAFVMRADNRGEGGVLALVALLRPERSANGSGRVVAALGLMGAALLYGDGMITPAISVLSAVEGLEVATAFFLPYVLAITAVILFGLFFVQHRGTARVGAVFGPVSLVWFSVLGVLGARAIVTEPAVLKATDPTYALAFLAQHRTHAFFVLGAVFLVVTGGEALYADMGHFGKRPIRCTWFAVVLPALLLNYFGQGALLLTSPGAARNPFYLLAPRWALYPLVLLATAATVIASQAVVSGCFSLTRQAIQLGYCPLLRVEQTSSEEIGQVYVPAVNWALMLAAVGLVLGFGSSGRLAGAYGVAVATTMVLTTILLSLAARRIWGWRQAAAVLLAVSFLAVDLAFFGANLTKIGHGGWFPLTVAAGIALLMSTWKQGRQILGRKLLRGSVPLGQFLADLKANPPTSVPGTAVFLTGAMEGVPVALLHNFKHNKVIHEQVILLTVETIDVPRVPRAERVVIRAVGDGFHRVVLRYGFMQDPNVPYDLELAARDGFEIRLADVTFFLGRATVVFNPDGGFAAWRQHLFAFMMTNGERATAYFRLPPNRVVEIGTQVEL